MVQLFPCWTGYLDKICVTYVYPAVTASFSSLSRPYSDSKCSSRTSLIRTVLPVSLLSCKISTPKAGRSQGGNGDTMILSDTPFKSKVYWNLWPTVLYCTNENTKTGSSQGTLGIQKFISFRRWVSLVSVDSPASKFRAKAKRGSCSWAFTVTSMARKLKGCLLLGPAVNGVVRCMSETGNMSGVRTGSEFVESNLKF